MTTEKIDTRANPEIKDSPLVRVNLGAGRLPREGWLNVDVRPGPGIDLIADLEKLWPWGDATVDEFYCEDFVEHIRQVWEEPSSDGLKEAERLADLDPFEHPQAMREALRYVIGSLRHPKRTYGPIHVMNEAWRCLKPGGHFRLRFPATDGRGAFQDPTHVSYWNANSFLYYIDGVVRAGYEGQIEARFKFESQAFAMSQQKELGIIWNTLLLSKPREEAA